MGPKDPISNSPFVVPVRRVAALPPAHWIELVQEEGVTKRDFFQGGRKRLKNLNHYRPSNPKPQTLL